MVINMKNKRHTFVAPECINSHMNCFGERYGKCMVLNDTKFKGAKCPFYKHIDVHNEERAKYPISQGYLEMKGTGKA